MSPDIPDGNPEKNILEVQRKIYILKINWH